MQDLATVEQSMETSDLMTPEELALFKKLKEKAKKQKELQKEVRENTFENLTNDFASIIMQAKKELVSISPKDALDDGMKYTITFGEDTSDDDESIDTNQIALDLLEKYLPKIEAIMGISNSVKLTGTYQGKSLFWQVRRREA